MTSRAAFLDRDGPMKEIADACIVVPANSTPHVESFHIALEHLICSCLKEKIAEP